MRGGLFSAGLGRAGKGINPQGGAKVKSAGRAGVKKRVNRLIPKTRKMCGLLSKKFKFDFGTEKISLDDQYIRTSKNQLSTGQLIQKIWGKLRPFKEKLCAF